MQHHTLTHVFVNIRPGGLIETSRFTHFLVNILPCRLIANITLYPGFVNIWPGGFIENITLYPSLAGSFIATSNFANLCQYYALWFNPKPHTLPMFIQIWPDPGPGEPVRHRDRRGDHGDLYHSD